MKIVKGKNATKIYPYLDSDDIVGVNLVEHDDIIIISHTLNVAEINYPIESLDQYDIKKLIAALEKASELIDAWVAK